MQVVETIVPSNPLAVDRGCAGESQYSNFRRVAEHAAPHVLRACNWDRYHADPGDDYRAVAAWSASTLRNHGQDH